MSCLTGKQTAIQEHHLCYNFFPSFEEFSVLATKSQVMERLLIGHCIMSVVSSQTLTPLEFWWLSYDEETHHVITALSSVCP